MFNLCFNSAEYPTYVGCPPTDDVLMKLPFERIKPEGFKIQSVSRSAQRTRCIWRVEYILEDGDLPNGPELEDFVGDLIRNTPDNAVVIDKAFNLPKTVEITYAVTCNCSMWDYHDDVQETSGATDK